MKSSAGIFFNTLNLTVSAVDDVIDETLSRALSLGAINYLPPIATIQTKSQKSRRVDLKAGLIKDDTGEHKNIVLLLHEHAVGNLDPITMKK
jgi:hypothetical protein